MDGNIILGDVTSHRTGTLDCDFVSVLFDQKPFLLSCLQNMRHSIRVLMFGA